MSYKVGNIASVKMPDAIMLKAAFNTFNTFQKVTHYYHSSLRLNSLA